MNILFLANAPIYSMGKGGGIPSVQKTIEALASKGHCIDYFYKRVGSDEYPVISNVRFEGYGATSTIDSDVNRSLVGSLLGFSVILRKFATLIKIIIAFIDGAKAVLRCKPFRKYDLIYCATENRLVLGWFLGRFLQTPVVLRSYGMGSYYWQVKKKPWRIIRWTSLFIFIFRVEKYIIVKDGDQSDKIYRLLRVNNLHIECLRNGIDMVTFQQGAKDERFLEPIEDQQLSLIDEKQQTVIGVCCRHWIEKRVDRLIKSVPHLIKKGVRPLLLIAGDGPEHENLKLLCVTLNISSYVRFIGTISREKLTDFYKTIDIYVQLNEHSNFGNTLFESMAAGCAVITSLNDPETEELLCEHMAALIMADPDNSSELADAIARIHFEPNLRQMLGNAATKRINEFLCSWESRMKSEIDILEEVAGHTPFNALS